jgi:serine/threonine-protein kinase HipA
VRILISLQEQGARERSSFGRIAILRELWRRLLFNVLSSNFDDHLRNHGFTYDQKQRGWVLSPAHDLNPFPLDLKARNLSLLIDDRDNTAAFGLVIDVGDYFGLSEDEMRVITAEVSGPVSEWRREAAALGIPANDIDRMATAFEHRELDDALRYAI